MRSSGVTITVNFENLNQYVFSNQYVFEYSNPKVLEYIKANNGDIMVFEAHKADWMQPGQL